MRAGRRAALTGEYKTAAHDCRSARGAVRVHPDSVDLVGRRRAGGPAAGGRLGRRPRPRRGRQRRGARHGEEPARGRARRAADGAGAPHVLLYGHYDVQTVAPLAAWDSPPFEPEVRDGYIYARGASDDKGNFHCLLAAAVDLARAGELQCDVTVVSDGEEEIGGDSVVRWLDAEQPSFDAARRVRQRARGGRLAAAHDRRPRRHHRQPARHDGHPRRALGAVRRRRAERGPRAGDADRRHPRPRRPDPRRRCAPTSVEPHRRRGRELGHAAVRRGRAGGGRDRPARRRCDRRLLPPHVRAADVRRERDHLPRRVAAPDDHPVRGDRGDLAAAGARPAGRRGLGGAARRTSSR